MPGQVISTNLSEVELYWSGGTEWFKRTRVVLKLYRNTVT